MLAACEYMTNEHIYATHIFQKGYKPQKIEDKLIQTEEPEEQKTNNVVSTWHI